MMKNACMQNCKIYFPDNGVMYSCPKCGGSIGERQNDKSFVKYYYDTAKKRFYPIDRKEPPPPLPRSEPEKDPSRRGSRTTGVTPVPSDAGTSNTRRTSYSGRISSYTTYIGDLNAFERFGFFFRGLHTGTIRHTVIFTDEVSGVNYQVSFYGTFAARSPQPAAGDRITVVGRPNENIFLTENVYLGEGGGARIRMHSERQNQSGRQNTGSNVLFYILVIAAVIALFVLVSAFFPILREITSVFILMFVLTLIGVSLIEPLRNNLMNLPSLLVISGLLTAMWYDVGGMGTLMLEQLVVPLVALVVTGYIIIQIFRNLF